MTDPTGAAVPRAVVTLRDPDTGLVRRVQTNSTGDYEFLAVPVGEHYALEVTASGFDTAVETGIKLLVNQKYRADFKLVLGTVSQTVEVSGTGAQVETSNTQLGDVIESKKMTSLPLNGRSYIDLLGLQPGVVPVASDAAVNDRPVSGNGNPGNLSVNGNRESANSFLVNGGDVEESVNNGASVVPTLDSIQEFRLLTNSFNAEFGRFSGGIVNVVTKSGTNEFHGSLYEFFRNDKLDSRSFFDPTRGAFKRNQFGGVFGGPILKNRLFFFSDYQGTRQVRGVSSGDIPVPSLLERSGDFSDLATTGYSSFTGVVRGLDIPGNFPAVLTQRLGYTVTSGEQYWFPGCTDTAQCVFPGAAGPVIPQSAWSPVAKAELKFIPLPTGVSGGHPFFSSASEDERNRDDKLGEKIDLNTQRFGNWGFYYYFDDTTFLSPYPAFTSNVPGFSAVTPSRAQQVSINQTSILSPTAVNEVHLSYTRLALLKNKPVGGLGKITDFGFVEGGLGVIPSNPAYEGVAPVALNQTGVNFGLPDGTTGQYNNTYQISDNFSKVIGSHTVKFGGDVRYLQINERNAYTSNGWFQFSGTETGNDFADFLLGAPDIFEQTSNQYLDSRTRYGALYVQDSYKVRSDLTVNYGLRWEVSEPFYDTQNRIQTFNPGEQSKVYPDAPTGFVFPGDRGIPKTLAPVQWDHFTPRLGVAYLPGSTSGLLGKIFGGPGKSSIRMGTGIFYTAIEDLTLFNEVGDAPFGLFYTSPVLVYLEEPYKARTTAENPGQRFPFTIPPPGATGIWPQYLPISGAPTYKRDNKLPYAEDFNFTIQRQLFNTAVLSVGYVGTRGHHLLSTVESNPGNAAKCLAVAAALPLGQGCGPYGEDTIYTLPSGQVVYGTRPYSVTSGRYLSQGLLDFSSNTWEQTSGNSNYNSLQVSLQKSVGALTLLAGYTWSKSLDNSSGFYDQINPFNPKLSKSLSAFDITHNFVLSYNYELPLHHLSSKLWNGMLSGWAISGITRFTTGFPITLGENDDAALCGCSGVDYPNYNAQPIHFYDPRNSPNHIYFSTDDFSTETIGVAGNANRRFFHGPGIDNWDLVLHKDTHIFEKSMLEFRAEFFNVFNHAQFTNPSGTVNASNFGQVTNARDGRIGQMALKLSF
ncbi:MAG: TonB-dependent receptor [Acidobacteriaceae bacterium]|nr:TonB-dependent receptor [Acidobacteriaceae bacterium]MBV9780369.1 TonB-dependent receptor [Acidobacteriaceae bacterium]